MRRIPLLVLALFAITNLGRGAIHAFAPDGGAHSIAGLDLGGQRQTILSLFALLGFHQIAMGLFETYVLVWRRELMVIALALEAVETAFGDANLYVYRTLPVTVPGAAVNAVLLAVLVVTLGIAWAAPLPSPPAGEREV